MVCSGDKKMENRKRKNVPMIAVPATTVARLWCSSLHALLKRGYNGTHHHMSKKHLGQYVSEFAGRHNTRSLDTMFQMSSIMYSMVGKRLKYNDLIA